MSVAKVTEISASSTKSFEDAVRNGVARANKTLNNADQQVKVVDGKVKDYVVRLKVTFVLD